MDNKTILIVDDIPANRMLLKAFLADKDYHFIEAENGHQGVELALEHKPDLILMDITMPIMSGIEATLSIKKEPSIKNIPVIATSALKSDERDTDENLFDGYLTKPIGLTLINATVERFLTK
ncbi:MAG: response regulator [Woeseiaceae bacterium]